MFEKLKDSLNNTITAFNEGRYGDVLRGVGDLADGAADVYDVVAGLFRNSLRAGVPPDAVKDDVLIECESKCFELQACCGRVAADPAQLEAGLDPATILLIIKAIREGIDIIREIRRRRKQGG